MYYDFEDPWGCASNVDSILNKIFLDMIFNHKKQYKAILDIGCALGDLTNKINNKNIKFSSDGYMIATDVSNNAIKEAKIKYPDIEFKQSNILYDSLEFKERFDLITLSEVFWYLVSNIDKTISNIDKLSSNSGNIAIKQYFPNSQKYFREYLNKPDDIIRLFERYNFSLIDYSIYNVDEGKSV